jgi:hypothetical protein
MKKDYLYYLLVLACLGGAATTVYGIYSAAAKYPLVLWVVLLLVVFMMLTAAVIYMRKFMEEELLRLYRYPVLKGFIDLACLLGSLQRPIKKGGGTDAEKAPAPEGFRLKRPEQFQAAIQAIWREVRGYDSLVVGLMKRLQDAVEFRQRSPRKEGWPPLGFFLFVGGEGVGKKYLTAKVTQQLFLGGEMLAVDLRDYREPADAEAALFGTAQGDGPLLRMLKRSPHSTVIVEHVEAAPPQVLRRLVQVVKEGECADPKSGFPVSFRNCLVVLTTDRGHDVLEAFTRKYVVRATWLARARSALAGENPQLGPLLELLHDVFLFPTLPPVVRAEVIALLARRECAEHGIELAWIDPEILAQRVAEVPPQDGFWLLPNRLQLLLQEPIRQCHHSGERRLFWRSPEASRPGGPPLAVPAAGRQTSGRPADGHGLRPGVGSSPSR